MHSWLKIALAAAAAFALACTGLTESDFEVPPRGATETAEPEASPSVLNIPMTVTYAALKESVEAGLPVPLYKETGRELAGRVKMDATIKKDGETVVSSRGSAMIIEVPAKVRVKVYREKLSGETGATLGTGSASLIVRVSTTPTIGDDWSLVGNTALTWRWVDSPSMRIASFDIELSDRLDDSIDDAMVDAATAIDAAMLEEAPLRSAVEEVWTDLGTARQLKRVPPVWVRFAPEALFATDPEMSGTGMMVTIGARGVLEASLNERMADAEVGPLAAREAPPDDDGARLKVPVKLSWNNLKKTLSNNLEGMMFEASGAAATITEVVDIYPSGDKVALGLLVNIETPAGSVEAAAWVTGELVMDTAGERITISDFTYDAATGQALIDAAHDSLKSQITERLQSMLTVPISDEIADIETTFTEILSGVELSDGVVLSGTVSQVRILDVRQTDQFLILDTSVVCDLSMQVTASQ